MAKFSDYLESRSFNRKLYNRLLLLLNAIELKFSTVYPDIQISISMSAKTQKLYVKIECFGDIESLKGDIEIEIEKVIDEIGFTNNGVEIRFGAIFINFSD